MDAYVAQYQASSKYARVMEAYVENLKPLQSS